MKKIVFSLFAVVLLGSTFVFYWVYLRYIKQPVFVPLTYQVVRGDLKDLLHVRGDVIAEREYDLAFHSFGTVASVPVEEGQVVRTGDLLMKLETTDLELQLKQLFAEQRRAQAASESATARYAQAVAAKEAATAQLRELQRGTRPEELRVVESQVEGARVALQDAKLSLVQVLQDAYTKSDDAIHNIADQMFVNPRSSDPQIAFSFPDSSLRRNIELQRLGIEPMLVSWLPISTGMTAERIANVEPTIKTNIRTVASFLDQLALAVNSAMPSASVSASTIATWQTNLSLARSNINLVLANMNSADATLRSAQTSLTVAQNELEVMKSGTSDEQIAAQEANVKQAEANMSAYLSGISQALADTQIVQAQIELMRESIRKASLYAPGPARVTKLWIKANEQYQQSLQGMPAISLATTGIKVQSDISEVDIPKIREQDGNAVTMVFDAFPERTFTGRVIMIEPKEILKEGDTYYRVHFQIDGSTDELRRGMSADVTIQVAEKKGVLHVPVFVVREQGGKKFVSVLTQGITQEVEVTTGITDGNTVEILSGLAEGQTVVVTTD